jgi:hypothetical protein
VKARVSLPEVGSKTRAKKNLFHSGDVTGLVSVIRNRIKVWPFADLMLIISMLIAELVLALPGGRGFFSGMFYSSLNTSSVTITPKSVDLANTFEIFAITGAPDPNRQEIAEHILTATSSTQSKTVTSTGTSIPGTRATGTLAFTNTSGSAKTFSSVILTSSSGVQVSFNGPITVPLYPPTVNVTGFAVNVGSAGNIGALQINGNCCTSGITVRNYAFRGGQDPQPSTVVKQSDINGAASALTASLTPGTQATLQKQVLSSEQIIANTLQCKKSTFTANHTAGDPAPNVTVTVAITCQEEVYYQQTALTMATNLLKTKVIKGLLPNYALKGNIITGITKVTEIDPRGMAAIYVMTEGEWVYQFNDTVKEGFAKHIAKVSKQSALRYLMSQPGVSAVKIDNPNGNTLSDASHITIEIVAIPGATRTPTVIPGSPSVAPNRVVTPTPTQGLGGS